MNLYTVYMCKYIQYICTYTLTYISIYKHILYGHIYIQTYIYNNIHIQGYIYKKLSDCVSKVIASASGINVNVNIGQCNIFFWSNLNTLNIKSHRVASCFKKIYL